MRQTCIGAMGSNILVRNPRTHPRVWAALFLTGLVCGDVQVASALSDQQRESRLATEETFQPNLTATAFIGGPDSTLASPAPAAPTTLFSESYWSAFADVDLAALHTAAKSDPETRFAEAMTLLANGNIGSADSAFAAASQQRTDINVAVAAQVMLATTLRYEHKWSQLRDLPLNSLLSAPDKLLTSELEQWGKAFADAEPQVIEFPSELQRLPLKVTAVGTPMIRVRMTGNDYDFWLDTGSSMTVISSAVAADAKISALSPAILTVRTFAGSAPVRAASVARLEIGSIVIVNCPAVIIDESLMYLRASAQGVPPGGLHVDGIIGWDTLRQFDLTMDYADGEITLAQPVRRSGVADAERTLAWVGKPMVEVGTKAGAKLHFMLDTGAQSTFLNATVVDKAGASAKKSDTRVFGLAKTGRQTDRVVPFLTVKVGGKSMRLQDVIVYGPVVSSLINSDGILGSDVARFGPIHIDATNGVFTVGALAREDAAE